MGDEVITVIGCISVFHHFRKSGGADPLSGAARSRGGRGSQPLRSSRAQQNISPQSPPSLGGVCAMGREHIRGQSHIREHPARLIWAGGGAEPARSPSDRSEGEGPPHHHVPPPLGPIRHWSTSTLSKQTHPRTPPQTRTHKHARPAVTPTRRRRGCPPTELNRVRRQGEAEFRNLV